MSLQQSRINPEVEIFLWRHFLWVTASSSHVEEMADMDELFGSDGDSDNDQRGNLLLHRGLFFNIKFIFDVCGCLKPKNTNKNLANNR